MVFVITCADDIVVSPIGLRTGQLVRLVPIRSYASLTGPLTRVGIVHVEICKSHHRHSGQDVLSSSSRTARESKVAGRLPRGNLATLSGPDGGDSRAPDPESK